MQKKILKFILIYVFSLYLITAIIPLIYVYFTKDEDELVTETHSPMVIESSTTTSADITYDYFRLYDNSTGEISEVSYRNFLIGSLAYEMDVSVPEEALKAQVVATFSYYCYTQSQGNSYDVLWDSVTGYNYYTDEYLLEYWGEDYEENIEIIEACVDSVFGQTLTYDNSVACSAYYPISNGQTESADNIWGQDYDYLQAVASPYDTLSSSYSSQYSFSPDEIEKILTNAWQSANMDFTMDYELWFDDLSYTTSQTVNTVTVCGYGVTGNELRVALSLPSPTFSVEFTDGKFVFNCNGQGDGVGMSQTGAIYMANDGASYQEILLWYYPGTILCN